MAVRLELVKAPSSFLCLDADALSRTLKCGALMAISSLTSLGRPSTFLHLSAFQRLFVWVCGISSGIDNTQQKIRNHYYYYCAAISPVQIQPTW